MTQYKIMKGSFRSLREKSEKDFRMPTLGEEVNFLLESFAEKSEINQRLGSKGLIANTAMFWTPDGLYVEDNPSIRHSGRVEMDPGILRKELNTGTYEEGVYFSKNRKIQFTSQLKAGEWVNGKIGELSQDPCFVAIMGGKEFAEDLDELSQNFKRGMFKKTSRGPVALCQYTSPFSTAVRIPCMYLCGFGGLAIDAVDNTEIAHKNYAYMLKPE